MNCALKMKSQQPVDDINFFLIKFSAGSMEPSTVTEIEIFRTTYLCKHIHKIPLPYR
jgi:hypothetical protein